MNKNKEQTLDDVEMIVDALINKRKRMMRYKNDFRRIARNISPTYRDFIYNIIKSNSVTCKVDYNSCCKPGLCLDPHLKLTKRSNVEITFSINSLGAFAHELGHAVDFWFGANCSLTTRVIIEDNKTLFDIFNEEFEANKAAILNLIMNEFKEIVNSNINDKAFDILINNLPLYRSLLKIPVDLKDIENTNKRNEIQNKLYQTGFIDVYYQMLTRGCPDIINYKYSPILDALSSRYDFKEFGFSYHDRSYYLDDKANSTYEFFANVFEAEVTSKFAHFTHLMKYLPKSFAAFEKLFNIFYEHIQNNKKFTDVNVKEIMEEPIDEE